MLAGAITLAAQTCMTVPGATDPDGSVSATATFTVSDGSITVTVANGLADPTSAGQLLNGVAFTLTSGLTGGTLSSDLATIRRVLRGGSYSDTPPGPLNMGWALDDNFNTGYLLCVLCTDLGGTGPKHLLIGDPAADNKYDSANASIAGNKPHNPFTAGTATFVISIPGLMASDSVSGATFFFSTAQGVSVPGSCTSIQPQ
jgi:hypothetical protein